MNDRQHLRLQRPARGFSLIEAMVALSVTTMAAAALLLALETSLSSTSDALERTIATGIAEQLLDEALGLPYVDKANGDVLQPVLSASGDERIGKRRDLFDDIDDYNDLGSGYSCQPPLDPWAIELGQDDGAGGRRHASFRAPASMMSNWREEVEVYYVDEANNFRRLASGTSHYRAVEVRISRLQSDGTVVPLVNLRRVHAYVPSN